MTSKDALAEEFSRTSDGSKWAAPFGSPHVFVLLVMEGEDPTAVHRIIRPETLVGRAEENHFTIRDEEISKVHCKIRADGSVCTVSDAGSRNGTHVNGRRLAPNVAQRLRHLDEIELGNHRILFLSGRARGRPKKSPD